MNTATTARYDKATRKKIRTRIKALHSEGNDYDNITTKLKAEGFTAPSGRELQKSTVITQGLQTGVRKNKPYKRKKTTITTTTKPKATPLPDMGVISAILAMRLTDTMKLSVIKSVCGLN